MDHDQLLKEMLREFVWELLALFLPHLLARVAPREIDWQRQDVYTNPPLGVVRRVDLLGVVSASHGGSAREELLNLEVESAASLTEARRKIGSYYSPLRNQYSRPVTTLALYLKVGLQGTGWDEYAEHEGDGAEGGERLFQVRWRYVGLPALPAVVYLRSGNWLGVALSALMDIEPWRRPWLRAEILRRVATECRENDYRRLLLLDCVEAYLPMEGRERDAYQTLIDNDPRYREARQMILTSYGRAKAEGVLEATRAAVIRTASRQCGSPDEAARSALERVEDLARLDRLFDAAFTARSWEELLAVE